MLNNAAYYKGQNASNTNTSDSTYSSDNQVNEQHKVEETVQSSEDAIFKYMESLMKNKEAILKN